MKQRSYTENKLCDTEIHNSFIFVVDHNEDKNAENGGWLEVDVSGEPDYADPLLCTNEPSDVIENTILVGCDDNCVYGGHTFYDFFFFIETIRRK